MADPHVVDLKPHRRDFLLVDAGGMGVRVAHWHLKEPNETAAPVPLQPFHRLRELGIVPAEGKPDPWAREAIERATLEDALYVVLGGTGHEWRTVCEYVRATGWGAELP